MSSEDRSANTPMEKVKVSFRKIKKILKIVLQFIPHTFLPSLIIIIVMAGLVAGIKLLLNDITGFSWAYVQLTERSREIQALLERYSQYTLTNSQQRTINLATFAQFSFFLMNITYVLLILTAVSLLMSSGFMKLGIKKELPENVATYRQLWIQSMKKPFIQGKKSWIIIGIWLGFSIIVPFGLILFFYPGFFILLNRYFVFNTVLDDSVKDHYLNGAKYYTKKSPMVLMMVIMTFFIFPMVIGLVLHTLLAPSIFSSGIYNEWIDPENFLTGKLFLYHFVFFLFLTLPALIFPTIYQVCYLFVKSEMHEFNFKTLSNRSRANFEKVNLENEERTLLTVQVTQEEYKCTKCGNTIPLGIKYCDECGEKYYLLYEK